MSKTPAQTLWVDLETTHSDENIGQIIEMAIILCNTSPQMEIVDSGTWPIHPLRLDFGGVPDVVREMHFENGLWRDAFNSKTTIEELDSSLDNLLSDDEQTALAGSGVAHFDSRWIRRHMPLTAKKLTYWAFDVGVLRRTAQLCGLEFPDFNEKKTHRAMDDVILHRQEFVYWADKLSMSAGSSMSLGVS